MGFWNPYSSKVQLVKPSADKTPLRLGECGSLSCKIEGNTHPDIYTIRTVQFGLRNIYVPQYCNSYR